MDLIKQNNAVTSIQNYTEEQLLDIANKLCDSAIAKKNFGTSVDGKTEVNVSDVFACIMIGREMGIPPSVAIGLGKTLNPLKYDAVMRGKAMGVDPTVARHKIHNIPTQNGDILYIAVEIISAKLIEAGVQMKIIRDFAPVQTFQTAVGGLYAGHLYQLDLTSSYIHIESANNQEGLTKALQEGKLILIPKGVTKVTSIRYIRPSTKSDEIMHYSLQDAIDAGLYPGENSRTKEIVVKGKIPWLNHPANMTRNRNISIYGRIFAADIFEGGFYTKDEASEIANIPYTEMEGDE